jgi:hypothetical protein
MNAKGRVSPAPHNTRPPQDTKAPRCRRDGRREARATASRVDALAADVGRLRRHLDGESYSAFLAGRIADHVETLDAILEPTAADLVNALTKFGVEDEEAVLEALATVDGRCRELRALLGGKTQ